MHDASVSETLDPLKDARAAHPRRSKSLQERGVGRAIVEAIPFIEIDA